MSNWKNVNMITNELPPLSGNPKQNDHHVAPWPSWKFNPVVKADRMGFGKWLVDNNAERSTRPTVNYPQMIGLDQNNCAGTA
jgi:hypothetical protein